MSGSVGVCEEGSTLIETLEKNVISGQKGALSHCGSFHNC